MGAREGVWRGMRARMGAGIGAGMGTEMGAGMRAGMGVGMAVRMGAGMSRDGRGDGSGDGSRDGSRGGCQRCRDMVILRFYDTLPSSPYPRAMLHAPAVCPPLPARRVTLGVFALAAPNSSRCPLHPHGLRFP